MDRALAQLGVRPLAGATDRASGVAALLGGDSASRARGDSAMADTAAAVTGRILQDLIQPSAAQGGATPGEYMVAESAYLRVDSLINVPEVQRAWPERARRETSHTAHSVRASMKVCVMLNHDARLSSRVMLHSRRIGPASTARE